MGGYGSSRWRGQCTRGQVEHCYTISARVKGRGAPLYVGLKGCWIWKNFQLVVDYEVLDLDGRLSLALKYHRDLHPVKQVIAFDSTRPNYGGLRWWFSCPRCQRRVRDLHLWPSHIFFACRQCLELSYESAQVTRSGAFYGLCVSNARLLGVTKGVARRLAREWVGGYVHRPMLIGDGVRLRNTETGELTKMGWIKIAR